MPADWLPHVPVTPCTGPRKGKRLAAANNTVITQVGEKRLCGKTDDGYKIDWSFIACDGKKALKSTASTRDDGHWVVHTKNGGWVINTKTREKTPIIREGNNYVMYVWVWVPQKEGGWTTLQNKGKKYANNEDSARQSKR